MNNVSLFTKKLYIPGNASKEVKSGMNSKTLYAQEAYPGLSTTSNPEEDCYVMLVEPLGLDVSKDKLAFDVNMEALSRNKALKILWTEEQHLLRFSTANREKVLSIAKRLACCNEYQKSMLIPYNRFQEPDKLPIPMSILRTPIDSEKYKPAKKKDPKVIAIGRVCREKNIMGVIEVFKRLPKDVEKVYIGNQKMWGEKVIQENSDLERSLRAVVDRWEPSLTRDEVAEEFSTAWGYFNVSIYDVGCLSFLEAGMAGAHCFAWNMHPMFDEYTCVNRFDNYEDGAKKIMSVMDKKGTSADTKMRNQIKEWHDYPNFRAQLQSMIGTTLVEMEEKE